MWCPASRDVQQELVTAEPDRFFEPPASGSGTFSTWLGVHLDLPGDNVVDWDEIAAILRDAYRLVAPKRLIAELDAR